IITVAGGSYFALDYHKDKREEERIKYLAEEALHKIKVAKHNEKIILLEKEIEELNKEKARLKKEESYYFKGDVFKLDVSKKSKVSQKDLKKVLRGGTVGLEKSFLEGEQYGVNAVFLVSIAALESAWGTINFRPNNMFGYGGKGYKTKRDNIMDVAKGLGTQYLSPSGGLYNGKGIRDVNKRYASSSTWDDKVGRNMLTLYAQLNALKKERVKKEIKQIDKDIVIKKEQIQKLRSNVPEQADKYLEKIDQ
ncbi:MAG: hypothetical protein ACRCUS_05300, partial [Anaerovoracaceae bacterium]